MRINAPPTFEGRLATPADRTAKEPDLRSSVTPGQGTELSVWGVSSDAWCYLLIEFGVGLCAGIWPLAAAPIFGSPHAPRLGRSTLLAPGIDCPWPKRACACAICRQIRYGCGAAATLIPDPPSTWCECAATFEGRLAQPDPTAKEADLWSSATLEKDTELSAPSASGDAQRYICLECGRWLTRRCA